MNLLDLCTLMKDARLLEVTSYCVYITREARWPSEIDSASNGFEPWPGTLCCVLGLDTLPSQCLSSSRGITSQFIAGNPAVDSQPIQGGVEILLVMPHKLG